MNSSIWLDRVVHLAAQSSSCRSPDPFAMISPKLRINSVRVESSLELCLPPGFRLALQAMHSPWELSHIAG
eukprot:8942776-Heterocapsa_arctica.AAC.1